MSGEYIGLLTTSAYHLKKTQPVRQSGHVTPLYRLIVRHYVVVR